MTLRHAGLVFAGEVDSIPTARHFAIRKVAEWGLDGIGDDVSLLVSELVTNAVSHARSGGTIDLVEMESGMHVGVSDGSHDEPTIGRGGPTDPSGRGLKLVDQLATAWGVEPQCEGKTVWFEVTGSRSEPLPA